ncbi:hypothetical protein K8R78_06215, partial [bacterium]|nr:hypothetical protein [bacterium]
GEFVYLAHGGDLVISSHGNVRICQNKERYELKTSLPVLFDCRGRDELTVKQAEMLDMPLSKAGIPEFTFEPGSFAPNINLTAPGKITEGEIEIERRLPYEGNITVKPGNRVEPDTNVGVNKYAPPKLHILNLNRDYAAPLTEDEIKSGILIEEGDEIKPGQLLFKLRAKDIMSEAHRYISQIRARVTHIKSQGVILAREIQDYDGKPHVVNVAKLCSVNPRRIKAILRYSKGDYIIYNTIIAPIFMFYSDRLIADENMTGTLKDIDTKNGTITVQYDLFSTTAKAFINGVVTKVINKHSATINSYGSSLYGTVGFGNEAWGELVMVEKSAGLTEAHRGMIAVSYQPISEEYLQKAEQHGLAGIIAPAISNSDWVAFHGEEMGVALTGDEDIPFTVILTEGFGQIEMNETYRSFFEQASGRIASVAGRTQIRAGVTRPRIIVSN